MSVLYISFTSSGAGSFPKFSSFLVAMAVARDAVSNVGVSSPPKQRQESQVN